MMGPRCTRRRSVTCFLDQVHLYNLTNTFESNNFMFTAISVDRIPPTKAEQKVDSPVANEGKMCTMRICILVDECSCPIYNSLVDVLLEWSPHIYLAALKLSIHQRHLVLCKNVDQAALGFC